MLQPEVVGSNPTAVPCSYRWVNSSKYWVTAVNKEVTDIVTFLTQCWNMVFKLRLQSNWAPKRFWHSQFAVSMLPISLFYYFYRLVTFIIASVKRVIASFLMHNCCKIFWSIFDHFKVCLTILQSQLKK